MELPRLPARVSPGSTRSSFESRHKSPLSISSSIDYDSSRTSEDSSYFPFAKHDSLGSRAPVAPKAFRTGSRQFVEPIFPVYNLNGAVGPGRQYARTKLMVPQKMAKVSANPRDPSSFGRRHPGRTPGQGFKKLPEELLLVMLGELKKLHLGTGSSSCSTCWMRDLLNLGLSCRKWWIVARSLLYDDIQLNGIDSALHTKTLKMKYGTRIKLLRRTLRARPDLAQYVKCLKVPSMPDGAKSRKEQDEYLDLVASLIMACPNLERFPGFYPVYNHEFSRFVNALSTRKRLTETVWVINSSPIRRQSQYPLEEDPQFFAPMHQPRPLLPDQCFNFLNYHSNWPQLQTLFLHCNPGGTIDSLLFTDIFRSLPSLEHLHVSSFPAPSFNDSTLTSLPSLRSLRLDNLPGITAAGLSHYAAASCSDSLTHLSLISLPLLSLPVLARLLSHLVSLTHFTISQAPSPALPVGVEIFLHPYLASATLKYLHWELTNPDDDVATEMLAKSISFAGFPSLRTIRAPTDFDGTLQKLCKPRDKIELPRDRYRNMRIPGYNDLPISQTAPRMRSRTHSAVSLGHGKSSSVSSSSVKSPTRSTFSLNVDHPHSNGDHFEASHEGASLANARRMAQSRLDSACTQPKFHIIVWDEYGQFVERFAVGGFIGMIQSQVFYSLKPDVEGMDEAVVTVDGVGGLLDGGEETSVKDACIGTWNLNSDAQGKAKRSGSVKEKIYWHTERGRWREVPLGIFF